MLIKLIKEVWYLWRFKMAVFNTNISEAAEYYELHREISDEIENDLKSIIDEAKDDISSQKEVIDSLLKDM